METWTFEASKAIARRGCSVVVYAYKTRSHPVDEVIDGVEVRRFGCPLVSGLFQDMGPFPYLPRIPMLLFLPFRLISDHDVQVLFVTYIPHLLAAPLTKLMGYRAIPIFHGFYNAAEATAFKGGLRGLVMLFTEYLALRMPVARCIAVSNVVKDLLGSRGVSLRRVNVIRGAVNMNEFDSVNSPKASNPQVCFVSRMTPERRFDDLLEAFMTVREKLPDVKLVAVGDGPMFNQWRQLVKERGVSDAVKLTGALYGAEKVRVMKGSHVMVHPSLREGMSLSILESLACSTPVIAYDIPEVREQLTLTGGGILVQPRDVQALAESTISLLRDHARRESLSAQGRRYVETNLTWDQVAHELLRVVTENA